MAITTMDGLIAAMPGQILPFYKQSMVADAAGTLASLWTTLGTPGAGSTPPTGTGATCSSVTAGALKFENPVSGNSYIGRISLSNSAVAAITFYDRLVHTSGLSGTSVAAQNVNTEALTRYTDGVGVHAFIEWYTATGGSAANFSVTYTDQAGTAGVVAPTQPFYQSPTAGQMLPITLNGADGIRRLETLTLSGTTGTAGNFGITLARRLLTIPLPLANAGAIWDVFSTGMPKVENNACLAAFMLASSAATGTVLGELTLVQG